MLNLHANILVEKITHIINLSFLNGNVPAQLKIAKVIPIYKKNDSDLAVNNQSTLIIAP